MKLRNLVLTIHGSIGIVMGLLLLVISVSGSSIVFNEEIDHALNRSLFYVTPQAEQVSLDTMLAPVQAAHPEARLSFVHVPTEPNESYVVNQALPDEHRLQTFVDPYTGIILGSRIWNQTFIGFMYTLHHDLFIGTVGQILVGVVGVLLLIMAISGIMLWPGWRTLKSGLRIRRNAPLYLVSYDIHKLGGIVSSLFLLILSFSGVVIVGVHFLPMFNQPTSTKPVPDTQPVEIATLLKKADAAIPEGKTTSIGFPEHDPELLTVRKRLPNQETGPFDLSVVELNRYSGEVSQVNKVLKPDGFFQVLLAIAMLHFGTFGGVTTRILYVLVGLMPTLLLITGAINWKRRHGLATRRDRETQLAQQQEPEVYVVSWSNWQ